LNCHDLFPKIPNWKSIFTTGYHDNLLWLRMTEWTEVWGHWSNIHKIIVIYFIYYIFLFYIQYTTEWCLNPLILQQPMLICSKFTHPS
jgi:hypothetical protein